MRPISASAATLSACWRTRASSRVLCSGRWRSRHRALYALVIGALSLRTRGVYFIMITLAFAQMAYYIVSGIARYGGDDGLTHRQAQPVRRHPRPLQQDVVFYYVCLALLLATVYLVWRLVNSRFGMVVQGARSNETRMRAIGFPTYRYKLVCFVIAGTLGGLAGALLANHNEFVSPSTMYWTRSGDLIVMVVLGGMGSVAGPVFGAVALLVLEEVLSGITANTGRSSSVRSCSWWCCSRAAASTAC